jgi:hypothetical protein
VLALAFGAAAGCKVSASSSTTSADDDAKPNPSTKTGKGVGDEAGPAAQPPASGPTGLTAVPVEPGPEQTTPPAERLGAGDDKCEDGVHGVGESWKDDCNTCNCTADRKVVCTRMACSGPKR